MTNSDEQTITSALYAISPDERDTWVRMGMAVKNALGDAGYSIWNNWSRQAESYKHGDAVSVWRSIKPTGGITIASLFAEAAAWGWQGDATKINRIAAVKHTARPGEDAALRQARAAAVARANSILADAIFSTHPYLIRKGFPDWHVLTDDELMFVPIRDARTGALMSIQMINPAGKKRFLYGGAVAGGCYKLGRGIRRIYCEGYATGISLLLAMGTLYRTDEVVVCFSAQNIPRVAQTGNSRYSVVCADNDKSGVGEKYARQTGLPVWMPPEIGDANDFHQQHGLAALANELRMLR